MRTWDVDFVYSVMTHPRIWPSISDDYAPAPHDFRPNMHALIYYLAPEHEGQRVGVFMYHPHSTILFEVHTCVLPQYWGKPAVAAARAGLVWMIENTACRKVITHVPETNSRALRFAVRVGMIEEGKNRASYAKDGALIDQHLLGITREEISCLRQQ
jgi:RimJ/RimL family protein N-acetyltransferase